MLCMVFMFSVVCCDCLQMMNTEHDILDLMLLMDVTDKLMTICDM